MFGRKQKPKFTDSITSDSFDQLREERRWIETDIAAIHEKIGDSFRGVMLGVNTSESHGRNSEYWTMQAQALERQLAIVDQRTARVAAGLGLDVVGHEVK